MKKLRKIMAFLLALVMVLALCACTKPMPIAAGKTTVGVKDGETVAVGLYVNNSYTNEYISKLGDKYVADTADSIQ